MRMAIQMYCGYCKACGPEIVGNSAFATMSTHFKRESLKKHCHSSIHKKCRDKYVVSVIDQAFQRQYDINQSVQEAELIVKFNTTIPNREGRARLHEIQADVGQCTQFFKNVLTPKVVCTTVQIFSASRF